LVTNPFLTIFNSLIDHHSILFRLRNQFLAVDPNCAFTLPNGTLSCSAFHRLSAATYVATLDRINLQGWGAYCEEKHISCGGMWSVIPGGYGACKASRMRQGPFLTAE
jgi:hypothetical protein